MSQDMGNKAKRVMIKAGGTIRFALLLLFIGALIPTAASATGADFASALYRDTFIDMQVKVKGRVLNVKRHWQDDHWTFLPELADLKFEYELKYNQAGTAQNYTSIEEGDQELALIKRGDFKYKKVDGGSKDETNYRFDERRTITKTAQGYIWREKSGAKIQYNLDGKVEFLEDRNANKITIARDDLGRIENILDPNSNIVLTLVYVADTNKISTITDYSERQIEYIWNGERLDKLKDVRGHLWKYGYESYTVDKPMTLLASITDPLLRATKINYKFDGGGMRCISQTVNRAAEQFGYTSSGSSCVSVNVPRMVILEGMTLPGDTQKTVVYDYFYDANKKEYYHKVRSNDGRVEESVINLNGETTARYVNNVQVMAATKDGNKTIIENEQGHQLVNHYDEWKRLSKVVYPDNTSKIWEYNKLNQPVKYTDENGTVSRYIHDEKGNLIKTILAEGKEDQRIQEFCNQYTDTAECIILKTSNCMGAPTDQCAVAKVHGGVVDGVQVDDVIIATVYDNYDNMTKYKDGEGNIVTYSNFDVLGNPRSIKDANQKEWKYTYDNAGNVLTVTTPLDKTTTYTYDDSGSLETVTDPQPNEGQNAFDVKYHYDAKGRVKEIEDSYGNKSTTNREVLADGQQIIQTDREGVATTARYDVFARLKWTQDGNGNKIEFVYKNDGTNPLGKPERIIYPSHTKIFKYNNRNRISKIYEQDTAGTRLLNRITYNKLGLKETITDANDVTIENQYNSFGQLKTSLDAEQNPTVYQYDPRGNLLSLTDTEGSKTQYRYDKNNQLKQEIRPLLQELNNYYNIKGQLETSIDFKGNKTEYQYYDDGQLKQYDIYPAQSETAEETVSFDYYDNGLLKSYQGPTTSAQYSYDDLGRLKSEDTSYGSFNKQYSYEYYTNGVLKNHTDAEGVLYQYSYDTNNQLDKIVIPGEGTIAVQEYDWIAPKKVLYPRGTTIDLEFTSRMQTKNIKVNDPAQTQLMNYNYQYDDVGSLNVKTTEHGVYDYGYDQHYRLTSATNPNADPEAFTYDTVGNRLTTPESTQEWTYNNNHELKTKPGISFDYDDNGSLTTVTKGAEQTKYIYNASNRLAQIKDNDDAEIATYQYDPFGRRISKEVSGTKTWFHYTQQGLAGEYTQTGDLIRAYGYIPQAMWGTDPLYLKKDGKYYYYLNDSNGTTQKLVTGGGAVVWDAKYSAFGQISVGMNQIENPLRMAGQYEDKESGLYYNYHRYYDPSIGRYVTSDPIGLRGGINTYAYVGGNPIRYIDPYGLETMDFLWGSIYWATGEWSPDQATVNYFTGLGDGIISAYSFGFIEGQDIRDSLGVNGGVDRCSDAYFYGELSGIAVTVAAGGAASWRLAGARGRSAVPSLRRILKEPFVRTQIRPNGSINQLVNSRMLVVTENHLKDITKVFRSHNGKRNLLNKNYWKHVLPHRHAYTSGVTPASLKSNWRKTFEKIHANKTTNWLWE